MDKSIPAPAARLLDFIGRIEAPKGYGAIYGNNQDKLEKPLTAMTLAEVLNAQKSWSKRFKSSAAGRYQFMRATLLDLAKKHDLKAEQPFDADFQDRLALILLERRGYDDFLAGRLSRTGFGRRLAMEWASLPVLAATDGKHREVARGETFYAGDKLNRALVEPAKVEAALDAALALHRRAAEIGPQAVSEALEPVSASAPSEAELAEKLAPRPARPPEQPLWRPPGIAEQRRPAMKDAKKIGIGALIGAALGIPTAAAAAGVDLGGLWAAAAPFVAEFFSAIILVLLSLLTAWAKRKFDVDIEAKHREALHSALVSGLNYGLARFGDTLEGRRLAITDPMIATAVAYAAQSVPDAIARFGLTPEKLRQMVLAKAPQVLGITAPAAPPG